MISRIRFRVWLPCAVTALMLCLCAISLATRRPSAKPDAPAAKSGEDTVTFSPSPYPKTSLLIKAAIVVDAPAIELGGLVLVIPLLLLGMPGGEVVWIGAGALLTPLIWFPIGRWVDQQIAGRLIAPRSWPLLRELGRFGLCSLSGVCLLAGIFSLTPLYHHRTSESVFLSAVLVLWCGGYMACSIAGGWRLQRRHSIESQAEGPHP